MSGQAGWHMSYSVPCSSPPFHDCSAVRAVVSCFSVFSWVPTVSAITMRIFNFQRKEPRYIRPIPPCVSHRGHIGNHHLRFSQNPAPVGATITLVLTAKAGQRSRLNPQSRQSLYQFRFSHRMAPPYFPAAVPSGPPWGLGWRSCAGLFFRR